jgi:LysM repeat protein
MQTSSSNGSYLPILGAILGGIGLIVGIIGVAQANKARSELATARTALEERISDAEASVSTVRGSVDQARAAADQARSSAADTRQRLDAVVQQTMRAFEDVSGQFRSVREDMNKLAAAHTPRSGGTSGAPTIPPGTLQEDGTYIIKQGDTFSGLARQFNIPVAQIVAANPGVDAARIRVGQRINIPRPAAPAPTTQAPSR